ncbi:MAG TPA: HTTM domain-containing protein [Chthoniobacterales bacterium]
MAFLFAADSGRWLTLLRIGLGLVIISYAWPLRGDWNYLFGGTGRGLISRQLFEALASSQSPLIPRLGWLVTFCGYFGLSENFALSLAWALLLGAGCFLLVGFFSRPAAILAWFLQLAAAKSGGFLSYGADNFITIGLFYLMIAPLPDRWSLDQLLAHRRAANPDRLGFHRRLLQIHLCFIYLFSGLTKCLGAGWWDGTNIWRSLTMPPFDLLPIGLVASCAPLLPALGISICLLETSYSFLIWPRWSRRIVLCAICLMHAAIGLTMGMYLFALIMIVLNLAAFGPAEGELAEVLNDREARRKGGTLPAWYCPGPGWSNSLDNTRGSGEHGASFKG